MFRRFCARALVASFASLLFIACAGAPASAPGPLDDVGNTLNSRPVAGDESSEGTANQPGTPQQVADQALIVHTGSLELEVTDLAASVRQGEQIVTGLGGHVASSQEENSPNRQLAKVSYRVPAERWSEALAGLKGIASRLVTETTQAQDVTAEVVDLDARIANLRASESALQAIMVNATTITDVLKVQTELTSVRGDIESMTAKRELLANRAALGTIDVAYTVPVAAASVATGGWDLGHEVDAAVAALVRLSQGFASLVIWVAIVVLPVLIPVLLVTFVAVRIRRRWLASRPVQEPLTPSM
jgi:uncharacterized protein DUF4349